MRIKSIVPAIALALAASLAATMASAEHYVSDEVDLEHEVVPRMPWR